MKKHYERPLLIDGNALIEDIEKELKEVDLKTITVDELVNRLKCVIGWQRNY